jgi:hypothetical protein
MAGMVVFSLFFLLYQIGFMIMDIIGYEVIPELLRGDLLEKQKLKSTHEACE